MKRPATNDPIWSWMDQRLNGTISAQEGGQLEARLTSDPDARQLFLDYCELHANLALEAGESKAIKQSLACLADQLTDAQGHPPGWQNPDKQLLGHRPLSPSKARRLGKWFLLTPALAASIMLGAGAWMLVNDQTDQPAQMAKAPDERSAEPPTPAETHPGPSSVNQPLPVVIHSDEKAPTSPAVAPPPEASTPLPPNLTPPPGDKTTPDIPQPADVAEDIARIVSIRGVEWRADATTHSVGQRLPVGHQIEIESGIVELGFDNGARIAIKGPASFLVTSETECEVISGTLTASVPAEVQGFLIHVGHSELVSLGATFSLFVSQPEAVDVHVHAGEVVYWNSEVTGEEIHILAGNLIRSDPDQTELTYLASSPTPLVDGTHTTADPLAKGELPLTLNLALWLAADANPVVDEHQGVITWPDLIVEESQTGEDAWQSEPKSRPTLVADGIGGKPVLRFDGTSDYLTTEPLLSTPDQTLFFVFRAASDFERPRTHSESLRHSRQLINYNGPVHAPGTRRTMPHQLHALQLCDRLIPGIYWGRVYSSMPHSSAGGVHLGSVGTSQVVEPGDAVVLTYAFHPTHNRAGIYLNGVLQGVDTAPFGRQFVSCKVIGRSPAYEAYFHGDMAEILIYNDALDGAAIASVCDYLGRKYSIEVSSKAENLADYSPQQIKIHERRDVAPIAHWRNSKN